MKQQGLVMVFALLVLLSLTILGISAVSSSLTQSKMAMSTQQAGLAFDAAEAAIAGVFFESEDEVLLSDANLTDPLSEARQGNVYDPQVNTLSCFDENTQVVFVTPGVALRWFSENKLEGFDTVIVDEFHERRWDTDLLARIEHDLYYIEHWSLLFDLKIILLL